MAPAFANLNLSQKGLLLVSMPLAVGSIFVIVLFYLLNEAEHQTALEQQDKTAMAAAGGIVKSMFDTTASICTYALTRSPSFLDRYNDLKRELPSQFEIVRTLVGKDEQQLERLRRMELIERQLFGMVDSIAVSVNKGESITPIDIGSVRAQMLSLLNQYMIDAHDFQAALKEHGARHFTPNWKSSIRQFLCLGLLCNVLITVWLALFFSGTISRRLLVMKDNTFRLAANKPLNARLGGQDEIALLDGWFHSMAGQLEEADRKQRAVIDNAQDVICSINAAGDFLSVSQAALSVWGYDSAQLIGANISELIAESDIEAVRAALASSGSSAGCSTSMECRVKRKDSSIVDTVWSAYWSASEKAFFCVVHDITERKIAEEALKASEHRIRQVIQTMPVGLVLVSESGIVELCNLAAEAMFQCQMVDLNGKSIEELFIPTGEDSSEPRNGLIAAHPGQVFTTQGRRVNGSVFPVELSISELHVQEGRRLLVTVVDITERQEIERLKREFVAMVSHDLKTPLTSVKGVLALLKARAYGTISDRGEQMVATAESQVQRLIALISDLLLVERMDARKFELVVGETDLDGVLKQAVAAVSVMASEHNVAIQAPSVNVRIQADEGRLIQVMVNLLSNAVKFSPPGSSVSISCQSAREWLEVRVCDSGRGIPQEHLSKIFDRFAQVELADATERGGTGLGLPICKMIVEEHGGTIGVDRNEGLGCTFWFRLPLFEKGHS